MRHGDATAVVGQRHVFIAARLRPGCHALDADRAIGPVGMGVQIAANIGDGYQPRQLVCLGERDLAAILAQFRRDIGKAELLVDLFLGGAGDPPFAGKQAIFVELPVAIVGKAAQRDIVRLGAGEIEQRGAVALFRHGADIDLQAGAQHDGRARRAVGENLGDILISHQLVADRRPVLRRDQNVQIAHRVAAAAIAAGHDDAATVAQKRDQRLGFGFRHRELEALLHHRLFQRAGKFLFHRRAESAQFAQPSRV